MQVFAQGKACSAKWGRKPKLNPLQAALVNQIVRIMKLTAILLTIAFLQVNANGFSQTVTFSGKAVPLEKVFSAIKKQTGYSFFYYADQLQAAKKVTIYVKEATIEEVLNICIKDQPFEYTIKGKTIFIINKQGKETYAIQKEQENGGPEPLDVKGRITNAQGEPLGGATIVIKRTGKGTQANANGEFTLKNVEPDEAITISYTGYTTQTVKISGRTNLLLVMQLAENELDEAVVMAYGTTTRRFATGNIEKISAAEIEKQPVMNPLLALQGRIAGVEVKQTSGYASAPINVLIRGQSTVSPYNNNDPLYVIDGVPLTVVQVGGNQQSGAGSGFLQNGYGGPANGQSPLFNINPLDIESISVLKDADATSIFGSRGANGVILITTKRGKAGQTKFDVNVQQGFSKVIRYWKMLNTQQYVAMRREAFLNDNRTPEASNAPDLLLWDTTRYTNWQKVLWGKMASNTNVQVSLSGGNAQSTFRIATNYTRMNAITASSGADERASVSTNLTHRSLRNKFSISLATAYSFTKSDLISMPGRVTFAPNAPSIYNQNGSLNWKDWDPVGGNPFTTLLRPYTAKTHFLNANLNVSYEIVPGLSFTTNFGYNTAQANQIHLTKIASQNPASNPTGSSIFGNNSNKNWIVEPQLIYNTQIWRGSLSILIGGSAQASTTNGIRMVGSGYTDDALLRTISNAPVKNAYDNYGEYRYGSVFGRIGYNISDKYIFNINLRRDGSSNYGDGNQYGDFASVGGAWIFSKENWFKEHFSLLSFGKIRSSYGTAGSDGGIPYGYLTRWTSADIPTYSGIQPLIPTQHANPDYRWQQNKQLEIAINLGFYKDWVNFGIVYYDKKTHNQLLSSPTPDLSGFSSVIENLPALVQNRGWEFTISGKGINTPYFQWSPKFNFSINKNRFVAFPGLAGANYYKNGLVGKPLNGVYVLRYTGVDPETGKYTFEDMNKDGQIRQGPPTRGGDSYFKKLSPSFHTGFGFNTGFKGFSLSLAFSVVKQTGINALAQGNGPGSMNTNQPIQVLERWQTIGQVTNTGKFSTFGTADPNGYLSVSDIGYTDASFIRLQNLALSYELPKTNLKRSGILACKLFINANNLITITKYKGIDPEIQQFGILPPVKTVNGGLLVSF